MHEGVTVRFRRRYFFRLDPTSSTTPHPETTTTTIRTTTTPDSECEWTGPHCITASPSSCKNRPDGDYKACEGCTFFHSCVAGYLNYSFRNCPLTNYGGHNGRLVWDDTLKRCEYESTTCRCHVSHSSLMYATLFREAAFGASCRSKIFTRQIFSFERQCAKSAFERYEEHFRQLLLQRHANCFDCAEIRGQTLPGIIVIMQLRR